MEFRYMFKTAPNTIFAVDNRTIENNDFLYFSTSVYELDKNRHRFKIAGQAQDILLEDGSPARIFYEKWKDKSFETLSSNLIHDIENDLEILKEHYSYNELFTDTTFKGTEYAKSLINIEDVASLVQYENSLDNILSNLNQYNHTPAPRKSPELEL